MSATHPAPRRRPNRRQVETDRTLAALQYGLEALADKLNERAVREFQSLGGVMLRGARPVAIGTGGTAQPSLSPGSLVGWSVRNTGAAPALLYLRDGIDNTGDVVAVISLAVGESTRDNYAPGGITFGRGLFVDLSAGTIEGVIYLRGPE